MTTKVNASSIEFDRKPAGRHDDKEKLIMDIEEPKGPTILRADAVVERVGLSRTTIWRQERKGTFPRRIRLSDNAVGWLEEDILNWLANRPRGMASTRFTEGRR